MRNKTLLAFVFSLMMAALLVPSMAFAADESATPVKGLAGQYTVTSSGERVYNLTVPDEILNLSIDSPKDVTLSYDVYLPTAAVKKTARYEGKSIQITPTLDIRVPGQIWYTFFGYSLGIWWDDTKNTVQYDAHAMHYTTDIIDSPSFVTISEAGLFTKVSVKDAPLDTSGAMCFDIPEDKNYDGPAAIEHFTARNDYKILNPALRVNQSGSEEFFYNESVRYLWTGHVVSLKGTPTLTVDYAKSPAGVYNLDVGLDENVTPINSVTLNPAGLTVAKRAVTVKAKKKTSVAVVPTFSDDKVTVKTSKKKIATASYKKGKLTITGKKKGSTVITVTSGGISQKIKVKVKK